MIHIDNKIINENDTNNDNEDNETIDESWVTNFKEEENEYNDFYKEKVVSITLFFLYVNKEKELESISKEPYFLEKDGIITKDQLVTLIKKRQEKYMKNNSKKYKLNSLYRYNPCIDSEDVNSFIEGHYDNDNKFFIPERYLTDIIFTDTITIFQDLNSLFFIYYEKERCSHNNNNNNNITKKIIHVNFDKKKGKYNNNNNKNKTRRI